MRLCYVVRSLSKFSQDLQWSLYLHKYPEHLPSRMAQIPTLDALSGISDLTSQYVILFACLSIIVA